MVLPEGDPAVDAQLGLGSSGTGRGTRWSPCTSIHCGGPRAVVLEPAVVCEASDENGLTGGLDHHGGVGGLDLATAHVQHAVVPVRGQRRPADRKVVHPALQAGPGREAGFVRPLPVDRLVHAAGGVPQVGLEQLTGGSRCHRRCRGITAGGEQGDAGQGEGEEGGGCGGGEGASAIVVGPGADCVEGEFGRVDLLGHVAEGLGQLVVHGHDVASCAGPAGTASGSASSTASRRAAAWAWLFTVPGAMSSAAAISASLRSS